MISVGCPFAETLSTPWRLSWRILAVLVLNFELPDLIVGHSGKLEIVHELVNEDIYSGVTLVAFLRHGAKTSDSRRLHYCMGGRLAGTYDVDETTGSIQA
ncbi:unnamed protein product [Calypogeia fissa]